MDHLHYTANEHRKGQHLTFECRVLIQTRLKDGWSPNRIAKEIRCAPNTVEMRSSAELRHCTKEISSVTKPLPVKMLMTEIASHAAGAMTFSRNLTSSLL